MTRKFSHHFENNQHVFQIAIENRDRNNDAFMAELMQMQNEVEEWAFSVIPTELVDIVHTWSSTYLMIRSDKYSSLFKLRFLV